MKGRCKNGHPIETDRIVLLNHVVGVCTCGYKYLVECMPATHIKDVRSKTKERFHLFAFLSPLICPSCYKWMTRISIACHSKEDLEVDWRLVLQERETELNFQDILNRRKVDNGN